ncbi:hypothetical protein [Paenibacillus oceani]|uniref:Uncharacterized protein n=1 Tax=Paenibacillus oceani TaxID=2772510 RepID=A0A927CDP2_9BACL|nr:hypothetical protein [Paenibacillus oceani]MBD2864773.1 hypothetical protein [Paenibacillus oceani]
MGEKVIVFTLAVAAALIAGVKDWKLASGKNRVVYVLVFLFAAYTGYGYVTDKPLPNLHSAVSLLFDQTANRLDTYLKPQKEPEAPVPEGENEDE